MSRGNWRDRRSQATCGLQGLGPGLGWVPSGALVPSAGHAMILGMIPDCQLDNVRSVGNTASTGARVALLSAVARREIELVVLRVEKVETAIAPKFQDYFISAMNLPNAVDPFPNLARVVQLPVTSGS